MSNARSTVAGHFEDAAQQYEAAHLGMWGFLVTEILFFGGLFVAYATYRHAYPAGFAAGSRHTDLFFGTLNTFLLVTSSLSMTLAIQASWQGRTKALVRWLLITLGLAVGFVIVKSCEYHEDLVEHLVPGPGFASALPAPAQMFFYLYWAMTGLHSFHVLAGIGLLGWLTVLAQRGCFTPAYHTPVVLIGLYWHFVDLVWLFLYPLLYLIDRHS